jgi:hypothetical protein
MAIVVPYVALWWAWVLVLVLVLLASNLQRTLVTRFVAFVFAMLCVINGWCLLFAHQYLALVFDVACMVVSFYCCFPSNSNSKTCEQHCKQAGHNIDVETDVDAQSQSQSQSQPNTNGYQHITQQAPPHHSRSMRCLIVLVCLLVLLLLVGLSFQVLLQPLRLLDHVRYSHLYRCVALALNHVMMSLYATGHNAYMRSAISLPSAVTRTPCASALRSS